MNPRMRFTLVILGLISQLTLACTNINQASTNLSTAALGSSVTVATSTSTVYSHTLNLFSYVADSTTSTTTGTPNIIMTLTANTSISGYQPLTAFCGLNGTNPCACEMSWSAAYTSNGQSASYVRTKRVSVTSVQSGLVTCSLDGETWSEIPDTTVITFNIVPVSTNVTGLNVKGFSWKKGTSLSADGDFLDDTLTPFRNIHRYTCFSKNSASRAYELVNQYAATSASGTTSGQPINVIMGSRYCSGSSSGSTSAGGSSNSTASCPPPRNGFSAQSYYRNFYIRSDQLGTINSTNDSYDCPKALESIKYSAGQTIPAAESGKYFPLDTTFALATSNSAEWNVGVPAATNLYKANDANSVQTACADEATGTPNRLKDGKTVVKCLGYARKPATNGTCGTIKDSNGRVRPLTRLRRFRVVYPPIFDANGKVVTGNAAADEIYVADRLAVDSSGNATGNMIYGPKPCNFAWFDHEGVTTRDGVTNFYSNLRGDIFPHASGITRCTDITSKCYATPAYIATSKYNYVEGRNAGYPSYAPVYGSAPYAGLSWSVDPDGLVLPNVDRDGSVSNAQNYASCSVTLPWVDWVNGVAQDLRLITTNSTRNDKISLGSRDIFLREIHQTTVDPWTPNYVEDISFNACVPLPTTIVEPPMHFYQKDANTMAWCAAVYPTQNPYWYDLNKYRKPQNGANTLTANVANYVATTGRAPVDNYTSHNANIGDPLDADGLNSSCSGTQAPTLCAMTGFSSDPICQTYLSKTLRATCDRTVTFDSNQQFLGFPLLAKDDDIKTMLSDDLDHDKGFSCEYSVNTDASKIGTRIPASGCCGYGGSTPHKLLRNLTNGTGGHLEPYKDPAATDDSRFCGWPVE